MTAYCAECHKTVTVVVDDVGIGPYEFHGAPGFDSNKVLMCRECEGSELWNDNPDTAPNAKEIDKGWWEYED